MRDAAEMASQKVKASISKYEPQWVDYVLALPSKSAMHGAMSTTGSYASFSRKARDAKWLKDEAKASLQLSPIKSLARLRIKDAEVSENRESYELLQQAANDFWESIDKKNVPLT
ncbi:MAG TPA: hypothetical protein VGG97_21260 [Bryobacteraceae bacterium]|jgi:hypothetical protein